MSRMDYKPGESARDDIELTPEQQVMADWFLAHYEDPVEHCPTDGGVYEWIWGGPHDAGEVLSEKYPDASLETLAKVVDYVESGEMETTEWANVPTQDEDDKEPDSDPEGDDPGNVEP